ncbi:MAG: hypothetical protein IKX89_01500 [Firmicutes bacterium]|nr:hypothetical protein [Bacillota bacterium]
MTQEAQKRYDEKVSRVEDAIALKEPDRVPMMPSAALFPMLNAGYTVAEVIYDISLEKLKRSIVKYLNEFDPDCGLDTGTNYAGEGLMLELERPKNMRWAGMPGNIIDINSIQQFIEYPLLLDDEFDEFFSDRTGWTMRKQLPRNSELLEPLATLQQSGRFSVGRLAAQVSTPEFKAMMQDLWKINDLREEYRKNAEQLNKTVYEMGYPVFRKGGAAVPFDNYSDNLRGTILSLQDIYERPEDIDRFIEENIVPTLENIRKMGQMPGMKGKHVFMALHKGIDGFMGDEHYKKLYWRHLQMIIEEIIKAGMVPNIFCEGRYNTRLDCLTEVTPGKVFYHFEEVDMALAKSKLKDIACIGGSFSTNLLQFSTPEKVRDEAKRLLDICAPGGGFIFATGSGLSHEKRENVEAMFDTVRTYGKYR